MAGALGRAAVRRDHRAGRRRGPGRRRSASRHSRPGGPHGNPSRAVHNTERDQVIAVLDEATVAFIPSRTVTTSETPEASPQPLWVKRGDVHNTQDGDVVRASTAAEVESALRGLAQ